MAMPRNMNNFGSSSQQLNICFLDGVPHLPCLLIALLFQRMDKLMCKHALNALCCFQVDEFLFKAINFHIFAMIGISILQVLLGSHKNSFVQLNRSYAVPRLEALLHEHVPISKEVALESEKQLLDEQANIILHSIRMLMPCMYDHA